MIFFICISCNSIINRAYNDTTAKYNGYFLAKESINEIESDLFELNNNNYDSLINLSYKTVKGIDSLLLIILIPKSDVAVHPNGYFSIS